MEAEVREVVQVNNEFSPPANISQVGGNLAVEQARASQEVMGAIFAAKRFPRDTFTSFNNIMKECERYQLAEKARYSFPRGNQTVSGPSIRLAEVIVRQWGNIDCGIRELEREDGKSVMQAYAWDLETNFRVTRNFTVEHIRDTKQGRRKLTDQRDIYELTASQGARRLRACMLEIVPGDVVEAAEEKIKETLKAGPKGITREDRVRKMVAAFDKLGVPKDAIEKRLTHAITSITDDEIVDLLGIFNSIKDNVAKRNDYFDLGEVQTDAAKDLTEKLKK